MFAERMTSEAALHTPSATLLWDDLSKHAFEVLLFHRFQFVLCD